MTTRDIHRWQCPGRGADSHSRAAKALLIGQASHIQCKSDDTEESSCFPMTPAAHLAALLRSDGEGAELLLASDMANGVSRRAAITPAGAPPAPIPAGPSASRAAASRQPRGLCLHLRGPHHGFQLQVLTGTEPQSLLWVGPEGRCALSISKTHVVSCRNSNNRSFYLCSSYARGCPGQPPEGSVLPYTHLPEEETETQTNEVTGCKLLKGEADHQD